MDELRDARISMVYNGEVYEDFGTANAMQRYYRKEDADKVIADLEESHKMEVEQLLMEIAELQKQVHDYAQGLYAIQARAEKELRHANYKRCLAMSMLCDANYFRQYLFKPKFWKRRHKRWLKLAEKFKPSKE